MVVNDLIYETNVFVVCVAGFNLGKKDEKGYYVISNKKNVKLKLTDTSGFICFVVLKLCSFPVLFNILTGSRFTSAIFWLVLGCNGSWQI